MKNAMKLLPGFYLIVFLVFVFLASCGKNDAEKTVKVKCVTCMNGGQCINDSCHCPVGYEGVSCQTASSDKVIGVWVVSEKGSISLATSYNLYIARDTLGGGSMIIDHFNNYFQNEVRATIIGDSIFIPEQTYYGKRIVGKGKALYKDQFGEYGTINMAYKVTDLATLIVNDYGYDSPGTSNVSVWNR